MKQKSRNKNKFKEIFNSWDKIDCISDGENRGRGAHLLAPYRKYFYNQISDQIKNRIGAPEAVPLGVYQLHR